MKRVSLAALAVCTLVAVRAATVEPPLRSATLAITSDGARLAVANEDSNSISVVQDSAVTEIAVCQQPRTVAIEGVRAFVPCGDGRIARVDLDRLRVDAIGEAGVEPFGVIAKSGRLYVSDHGGLALRVLDAETLSTLATIAPRTIRGGWHSIR